MDDGPSSASEVPLARVCGAGDLDVVRSGP